MVSFAAGLAGGIVVLALLFACAAKGVRDGDRPADALVSAVLRHARQPDERRPVIVATVVDPSGRPVLAGLSARPSGLPAWLAVVGHPLTVTVPRRTARAKFRPGGYATVGIVPASATIRFLVPVDRAAGRYVLSAALGQGPGRLRLHRLRVPGAPVTSRAELPVRR
jgi:hypothetical protein